MENTEQKKFNDSFNFMMKVLFECGSDMGPRIEEYCAQFINTLGPKCFVCDAETTELRMGAYRGPETDIDERHGQVMFFAVCRPCWESPNTQGNVAAIIAKERSEPRLFWEKQPDGSLAPSSGPPKH